MPPQTMPAKPVMDIAIPPKTVAVALPSTPPTPASAPAPVAPPATSGAFDVRPAPIAADTPIAETDNKPVAPSKPAPAAPQPQRPRLPVVLITVTIFTMLLLGGLAVIIYLSAHPA